MKVQSMHDQAATIRRNSVARVSTTASRVPRTSSGRVSTGGTSGAAALAAAQEWASGGAAQSSVEDQKAYGVVPF
jgi:hypothetical protein